jgi:ABC-type transport system involved in multi-copper enzyme maturation permease subunit
MSTAEAPPVSGPATGGGALAATAARRGAVRPWLRLLRSELGLMFRRWRNRALLAVVVAIPVLLGAALRVAVPQGNGGPGGGNGPAAAFLTQVAGNGVFLSFLSLTIMLTLVLPLVVAVVSGESLAGEASAGTLRYLLVVPAGRARLLSVKYVAVVIFALVACLLVAASALIMGVALFPVGPVTMLSGNTVPLSEGLLRLLFVVLYVTAAMAMLGAIGLAISSLTEHPIAAIAAIMILAVSSEVADNIPQFAAVGPYLPTHWWLSFDSILRTPIDTTELSHGLLSFGVYLLIFGSIAWARLTTADITS